MSKIKILRIIARLNIGGPAIHTVLLTEGLSREDFDSLLVCGSVEKGEGDMGYLAAEKNVTPFVIPELGRSINPFNDFIAFSKIYSVICKEKPDIIHTHTAKAGTLGRLAAILYNFRPGNKKIKLIHTFHGHIFSGYFNRLNAALFLRIERFLAKFTSVIITVSESVKAELLSLGVCPAEKIAVVPLGFELDKFLSVGPRSQKQVNIGIIGRLVPIKNHKLFLDAASIVLCENPGVKIGFMVVGDGPLKKELEGRARALGLSANVSFLGWQKDLERVYEDLDIVALTSINEGTPVSIIEAMACARGVVVTDAGGVRDLLGKPRVASSVSSSVKIMERGVLVASRHPQDFAEGIAALIKNRQLRETVASAGREFVRQHFSKSRLITDIENLYKKILSCV